MSHRVHTGGRKSFVYSGNEEYEDTMSTREFKRELHEHINRSQRNKWCMGPGDSGKLYIPKKLIHWILILLLISICVLGYQNKDRITPLITDFFEEDSQVTGTITAEEPVEQAKTTRTSRKIDICEQYSFSGDKYDCYTEQAVKNKKSEICKLLPQGYVRNNCYTTYAIKTNNIYACGNREDCRNAVQAEIDKKRFETTPFSNYYFYTLDGVTKKIDFTTYTGLNDYLAGLSRWHTCNPSCPTKRELELRVINNKESEPYLKDFVDAIKAETSDDNDRAKIAISLVQNIPYDMYALENDALTGRYPYEVLYDFRGVCGEKSKLLAYLLRELGFGVALFDFEKDNHMAVGVKCPAKYDYEDTGYCFVESTSPTIITQKPVNYIGGPIASSPKILKISDGKELSDLNEEYEDGRWMNQLEVSGRTVVSAWTYSKWQDLVNKYGLEA